MVQKSISDDGFPASRPGRLFHPVEEPLARFPIQSVRIDWDRQVVDLQLKLTQDLHLILTHPGRQIMA